MNCTSNFTLLKGAISCLDKAIMTDMDLDETQSVPLPAAAEEEPFLGMTDIFLVCMILGLTIYWWFFRDRKAATPQQLVKPLTVVPLSTASRDPSFINRMKKTKKSVAVFYGSQTGTAEEFAGRLARDCIRYGIKGFPVDPEECEMDELTRMGEVENSFALFCLATYGEGDPTDNAQEFFDWLQEDHDLSGLRYAVFGLGNKTYEHFNAMGIFVDKRLEELGAVRLCKAGMGDDDANIEEDFVTWRETLWPAVCEHFGIESVGEEGVMRQYTLETHEDINQNEIFTGEPTRLKSLTEQKPPYDAKNPYMSSVKVNRELHKGGDRSCMHIEFDISGSRIRYEAGDHVAVFPTNDPAMVEEIAHLLKVNLDDVFTLNNVDDEAAKKHPFPCPTTYRTALLHYVDIAHPPRTNVLHDIIDYASDPKDREFLTRITSSAGKKEFAEWVTDSHRDILQILKDLPSLKPPVDHLCELMPRLHARYYSISSSPKEHPERIHITAVLVDYHSKIGRRIKGVATNWLATKIPNGPDGPRVPIYVRKSPFRLPFKTTTPVIMIGPGTGLAPFRGFIQERYHAKMEGKPIGDTVLFSGCRKKSEDYIYQEELEGYEGDGTLSQLNMAFSRDQAQKVYVQHLIKQKSETVWNLLNDGAHVYVCGDARHMAHDVDMVLHDIVEERGGMTQSQAKDFIKGLRNKGRYACDVWS
ncbi:POR [Branchiostoma lanceolatum]|uniref:NADPH--cytochrome P450 reductase n=2 Tax=Branchiostoma lanceolatum TaxID=7740 RepID=A0A8J9YKL9_BRALA|nr:POR [Branchiostoma lanceolatum]